MKILWWAIIVLIVVGLVVLVVFAVRYLSSSSAARGGEGEDDAALKSEVDRIENLPFRIKRPFSDLLSAARRAYEAGNYNEAIVYLFSYQLVHLDKRRLIRLSKGKTNRQYVRELRTREEISSLIVQSMLAFEEVFFGNHSLSRPRFEDCWNRLDEFHRSVDQHTAA